MASKSGQEIQGVIMLAIWGPKQERCDPLIKAKRLVCWFSCGAASACATKLALSHFSGKLETHICYCDTGSEHPDNWRFLKDCEACRRQEPGDGWQKVFALAVANVPSTMMTPTEKRSAKFVVRFIKGVG